MVVGKTYSSITLSDLLEKYTETEILSYVCPDIKELPCKISSPFRKDVHPSFCIFTTPDGKVRYKDYGCATEKGGLLDFLCKLWGCTFRQMCENLVKIIIEKEGINAKPKQIKTFTREERQQRTKLQVAVRSWKDYDYEYWASYGIEKQWLKYAEIYPISHKIVIKKDDAGNEKKFVFTASKYAYCFVERKEGKLQLKIYQPFDTQYKWCSSMDGSVVGLWTKIPEYGDRVVICSSLKDALVLSCQCHIPAICLQGEGYDMSDTAVKELKRRYKKVFICFDVDVAGLEDGRKLSERTGFKNVVPDLGTEKDLSDYYKSLENKEEFKQLEKLFY